MLDKKIIIKLILKDSFHTKTREDKTFKSFLLLSKKTLSRPRDKLDTTF